MCMSYTVCQYCMSHAAVEVMDYEKFRERRKLASWVQYSYTSLAMLQYCARVCRSAVRQTKTGITKKQNEKITVAMALGAARLSLRIATMHLGAGVAMCAIL